MNIISEKPQSVRAFASGPVLVAEECVIAEGVEIKWPAVLGPRCSIAKGAIIEGSVLWDGSQVREEAVLRNCVVGSRSCVQENCHILEGCVLADDVTVRRGSRVVPGTSIWPDNYVEPNTTRS